jgi:hypothetical protein
VERDGCSNDAMCVVENRGWCHVACCTMDGNVLWIAGRICVNWSGACHHCTFIAGCSSVIGLGCDDGVRDCRMA